MLLAGRDPLTLGLPGVVADAELVGSLALAGIPVPWAVVRSGLELPAAAVGLRRAQQLLASGATLDGSRFVSSCLALGDLRRGVCSRTNAPPPAPPDRIEARLLALGDWLGAESVVALPPAAAGAIVLARIIEIAPLVEANGRLARLLASDVMSRWGAPRPILVAGDAERLAEATGAAFRMQTAPLVSLLEEASSRAVEVMIQALETGIVGGAGRSGTVCARNTEALG